MAGRHSRDKGAAFEREVAKVLEAHFKVPIKRILGQARDSGADIAAPGLRVECKRRKTLGPVARWYEQAARAASNGEVALVVMRADQGDRLAVLNFDDLLRLIGRPS